MIPCSNFALSGVAQARADVREDGREVDRLVADPLGVAAAGLWLSSRALRISLRVENVASAAFLGSTRQVDRCQAMQSKPDCTQLAGDGIANRPSGPFPTAMERSAESMFKAP